MSMKRKQKPKNRRNEKRNFFFLKKLLNIFDVVYSYCDRMRMVMFRAVVVIMQCEEEEWKNEEM